MYYLNINLINMGENVKPKQYYWNNYFQSYSKKTENCKHCRVFLFIGCNFVNFGLRKLLKLQKCIKKLGKK